MTCSFEETDILVRLRGFLRKRHQLRLLRVPGTWCVANAAACASSACERCCAAEYSCMLPLTSDGREGSPGAMPTSVNHFMSWLAR